MRGNLIIPDRAMRSWILAGLLASLVLFGPPPCTGQPQPADEQVKFAADAEKVKGHLLASRELYTRGERAFAAIHAAHPVQELWSLLRGPLSRASADLASRVGAILETPGRQIDAKVPTSRYEDTIKQVSALLDEAVSRVVPAEVRQSQIFRAKVILALIEAVEGEYEEAFKEGKIAQLVEYQDAYGFSRRGQALYRDFASQIRSKAPEAAKKIDGALAALAKGFGGVMPPASPLAMETVKKNVEQITTELAKAAGVQVTARRGAVEEIRVVRSLIQEALTAYQRGQTARAEELVVQGYLDHFEKAEGPLEQKDKTLMRKLEQLIRVELRGKIKAKAPAVEVRQMVESILASLDHAEKLLGGR